MTPGSWETMQLVVLNNLLGCLGTKAHYSEMKSYCGTPFNKESCLARGPYPWKQIGKKNLQ